MIVSPPKGVARVKEGTSKEDGDRQKAKQIFVEAVRNGQKRLKYIEDLHTTNTENEEDKVSHQGTQRKRQRISLEGGEKVKTLPTRTPDLVRSFTEVRWTAKPPSWPQDNEGEEGKNR